MLQVGYIHRLCPVKPPRFWGFPSEKEGTSPTEVFLLRNRLRRSFSSSVGAGTWKIVGRVVRCVTYLNT